VFYLALPPGLFAEAIEGLGRAGLAAGPGWTRLVVEKPFGTDLASARGLNELVHHWFGESQVYRIDHYLGKETVQNLLVFRFTNPLFERAWNRDRVRCVEITVAEDLGIGTRAGFYDDAGALRDIVQNHLAQVLTLVAMDPPVRFAADDIRNKKVEVLRAITPVAPDEVVFGQYTAGTVGGEPVAGYRDEPGVDPESTTETAVAMRLGIDSWRWEGVPFYIRTGKRFPRRLTRIVVRFQEAPVCLFHGEPDDCHAEPNILVITLQPEEGFDLLFDVKEPKEATGLRREALHFRYEDEFGPLPDAYETLLMDIIEGDQTLFVRGDETEASWRVFGPVIESRPPVHPYPAGTWGPEEARELPRRDGFTWFDG
jgi:glucose-6-phosphate 1-dehydrogenase